MGELDPVIADMQVAIALVRAYPDMEQIRQIVRESEQSPDRTLLSVIELAGTAIGFLAQSGHMSDEAMLDHLSELLANGLPPDEE